MNSAFSDLQKRASKKLILVIDREGMIGEPLALKLAKEFLVNLVSQRKPSLNEDEQNIFHIPFFRKFPAIPDEKYAQIVFIDEEGRDLELLPKIIEKVRSVNADLIAAFGLNLGGEYAAKKALRDYPSAKAVLFGDVFGEELVVERDGIRTTVNKFIYQARAFNRIQVLGEGLRETYPVFLPDVVDGLIELVFKLHRANSLFYLFPKSPPTELFLAHAIQKFNPEIAVDFIRHDSRVKNITYPSKGFNLLGDNYPIAQKIRKVEMKKKIKMRAGSQNNNLKKFKKFPFYIVWILIFLLFSPLIFTILFSVLGKGTFYYAKGEFDKGNFTSAKSSLHLSQAAFSIGKQTLSLLSFQAKFLRQENSLKSLSEDISSGYRVSESLSQIFNAGEYFSDVIGGKSKNPVEDFSLGKNSLKNSLIELSKIGAEGKIPAQISQKLEIINPVVKLLSDTSEIAPKLFGMEGQRTYLVLLQNNLELRPGGGFLSSYAILKINLGKVVEFSLHDVYDADGQLRGHVEPPFAIRRYLPMEHWYLRDSNFDVDYAKSALSAANFLDAETGQKVDGVIAVDTAFLKNILRAIGPTYVADYGQLADENNLDVMALTYPEKNFYPGYTQKKDFLRSLVKSILARMTEEKTSYLLIAQAASNALVQKDLLFAFNDLQNTFTVNGWSSSLWDERKDGGKTVNDLVGINEANLGTNRVNYSVDRQLAQRVVVGKDGSVTEELEINFSNKTVVLPGGDYKNYLRTILPKNTRLLKVEINDVPQKLVDAVTDPVIYEAKSFRAPQGLEVERAIEEEKAIFGFLVIVPSEKSVKVKLKYALSKTVSGLNDFSYNLRIFKQPGVENIPYSLDITYPSVFNIVENSGGVFSGEGGASYSEKITGDKDLKIDFAQK